MHAWYRTDDVMAPRMTSSKHGKLVHNVRGRVHPFGVSARRQLHRAVVRERFWVATMAAQSHGAATEREAVADERALASAGPGRLRPFGGHLAVLRVRADFGRGVGLVRAPHLRAQRLHVGNAPPVEIASHIADVGPVGGDVQQQDERGEDGDDGDDDRADRRRSRGFDDGELVLLPDQFWFRSGVFGRRFK